MAIEGSTDSEGRPTALTQEHILSAVSKHFPPELVNRLDNLLIFNKLSRKAVLSIVDLRLAEIQRRLTDRRISLDIGEEARNWIAKEGWSETYGARSIARLLSKEVLAKLARKLVEGRIRFVLFFFSHHHHHHHLSNRRLVSQRYLLSKHRNGDKVTIAISKNGTTLDVSDNHEPDADAPIHDSMSIQHLEEDHDDYDGTSDHIDGLTKL